MRLGAVELDSSKSYNIESYNLAQYTDDPEMYYIKKRAIIEAKIDALADLSVDEVKDDSLLKMDEYMLNLCEELNEWERLNPPPKPTGRMPSDLVTAKERAETLAYQEEDYETRL